MYHIILGSENGFLHKLVLFPFFFDNINNNKLHRHNRTTQPSWIYFKKRGKLTSYCSWERKRELWNRNCHCAHQSWSSIDMCILKITYDLDSHGSESYTWQKSRTFEHIYWCLVLELIWGAQNHRQHHKRGCISIWTAFRFPAPQMYWFLTEDFNS